MSTFLHTLPDSLREIDFLVIGGGAAGFFGALEAKRLNPEWRVAIFEKSKHLLSKIKVSGGGRCNVTHACFDPNELIKWYPRGSKELRGAFHRFQPRDTIEWFKAQGVELKQELDGRMFPVTDSSQTIMDCFLERARELGVEIITECSLEDIEKNSDGFFHVKSSLGDVKARRMLLASGGNPSSKGVLLAKKMGHSVVPHAPSLFTFNIQDPRLHGLQGISLPNAEVSIPSLKLKAAGPVLITHWGLSGPGILKLSAWAARELQAIDYKFSITLNCFKHLSDEAVENLLNDLKLAKARQLVWRNGLPNFLQRLWEHLVAAAEIPEDMRWAHLTQKQFKNLHKELHAAEYKVDGKSVHKEEFVTCGGIKLSEVDFRTLQSKIVPGLYFAGEILDVDGLTGGFNFQAAWTTSWIAAHAV